MLTGLFGVIGRGPVAGGANGRMGPGRYLFTQRYVFLSIALWWAGFTIFPIIRVQEEKSALPSVNAFDKKEK